MKRFLLIFVIAFGGLVATIGGIVGIKYLGGEFDTPVIMPEGIVFESTEYEIDGSLDTYQITIKSTNEDSTQNKVKLAFSNSDRLTDDKLHITDGNIIVPINVELNKPFTIQIVKDKSHTELQELGYTGNWTHGGVSQIVASSENIKAKYATASIFVDVPVYKTEMIMLSGESGDDNLQTIFGSIENSSLALSLETEDGEEYKSISSGQDVYLGIKFYPYDSAFRYSKIKSTNVYSEFKNKITELCNAKNVNFDDLFADFDAEISNTRAKALIEGYSSIMNNALNVLGNDLVNLIHNFESNLKYTNIVEVANSNKLNFIKRITGTNIYKFKSNTTLGEASLNGYAFCNINTETEVLARSTENILTYIMDEVSKNKAFQISSKLNVVDVEVDEITLNGSMGNIYVGTYYNIYADEIGTNNASESYLQIKLSNSDLPELDLQSKKVNLGIRFERKGTDGWSNANENISPVLGYGFVETLDEDDRTFYLLGDNTAWVVCANNVGAFEYRALIKYFVFDDDGDLKYTISLKDSENPTFAIQERLISDEKEVYWKDNSPITLTAVNLKLSEDETIVYEPEYDLNAIKFVDKDNAFKTVRYFIYSDDEEGSETLHEYFDTASDNFVSYKLSDGKTRKLYELSSSTLKLKSIETIPNFETRVLFATVNPRNISSDGKYELIKVSTNQNTGVIDEIILTVQRSLTGMSGSAEILDNGNAGVVDEKDGAAITKTLKVASDTNEVLSVSIKSDDSMLTQALLSDIITIYGKTSHDAHENYVRVSSTLTYNKDAQHENYEIVFKLNTVDVLSDTTISLFIAYTINNQTYFYPVSVKVNEDSFDSFVLVAHTDNTIRYYIGDGLDITRIDYIEMSYAFKDDVLGINYKLYYVDGTSSEYVDKSEIFDENGYIIHKIFNFLGKEDKTQRDDWYLTTTDASVIVVGDGKIITSVKSGDATIVIHLDNVNDELAGDLGLRTIKFRVINTGYISSYTLKDNTTGTEGLTRDGYTQTNPFPNNGLTAVKTGSNENRIELDGKKEGGILSVVYTFQSDDVEPGAAASKTALDFRITIDDTSLNAFKAITGKDNLGDGQTSFIITKDLGADVAIKVIFYNEQLNLTIVLTLDIKAVIQLESLVVEYVGNSETISLDNSGNVPVYTVYAEANFKITATLNALAYYIYNDESHGQVFAFTALDVSTSVSDYKDVIISNKQTPNIGDMQYRIKFNVLANIRISDYAKNGITINLEKDATKSISLYSSTMTERILDRLSGTNNLGGSVDISFKSNVKAEDFHVGNNTLDLDFTTNNFEDKITTQITVNYAGKLVGTFNITIYPYNYEKADATRLCYFRGEKAILLLAGDVAVNVLTAQFNYQTFTMGSIKGLKDVFNVSTGEVLGVDDNLLYNINNSEAAKNQWNYILVSDDAGNTTKYYLVISKVLVLDSFLLSFNNADTLDGVDLRDIDIYEMLYVMESSNTLLNYYNNNNVHCEEYMGGSENNKTEINLTKLYPSVWFNDEKVSGIELAFVDKPGESISNYITISNDFKTLYVSSIGFDSSIVMITLKYKNGNFVYSIPRLIEIAKSQNLATVYIFDERDVADADFVAEFGEYGTTEYDENNLTVKENQYFTTIPYEYVGFGMQTQVNVSLNNKVFTQKWETDSWVNDEDYNKGYNLYVEKVYALLDGDEYVRINSNNIDLFAVCDATNMRVQINRVGLYRSIRIKLAITTQYGAMGYYYIQADTISQAPHLTLQRIIKVSAETTQTQTIQGSDSLSMDAGKIVYVGKDGAGDYELNLGDVYYKVENYDDQLRFIADSKDGAIDNHSFTVAVAPNGSNFELTIYTRYGILAIISITAQPYYSTIQKSITLHGGVLYSIGDLVTLKQGETDVTESAEIVEDSSKTLENDGYLITDSGIIFKNHASSYKLSGITFVVSIGSYEYLVALNGGNEITIYPPVIIESNGVAGLEEKTLTAAGILTLSYQDISTAFNGLYNFNVNTAYTDIGAGKDSSSIKLLVKYNGAYSEITNDTSVDVNIGSINGNSTQILLTYVVRMLNGSDENYIEIVVSENLTVLAYYQFESHYPQPNSSTSFQVEYVPTDSEIDLEKNVMSIFGSRVKLYYVDGSNSVDVDYQIDAQGDSDLSINDHKVSIVGAPSSTIHELQIKYSDIVFGVYRIIISDSAYSIGTVGTMPETIYAGNGGDSAFGYVDVSLKVPYDSIKEEFKSILDYEDLSLKPTQFDIVVAEQIGDNIDEVFTIKSGIYYNASEANGNYYNFAITIEDYNKGLTKNNVFLKYETSDGTQYVKCADVKINQRYTVTYAGELVDYNYHNDIISIQEAIIVSELEDGLAPNNEYACLQSVIYKNSSSGNTLVLAELQYVVVCDITINNIDENNDDYDIQLNANEYPNGLSLVNILDIAKSNSRNLWCNDVDNEKTLTITEKGSSSNASEKSIRTYGIEVGDGIVFDYNINAVGAKNNGTIVTYELRYTVVEGGISFVYAKNFKVKVLSDVEFMLKNNDFTSTDNSQDHMLKISTTGTIMLVNGSQTNGDGTAYYVYAYGRYNENKTNIAARFNINVNGGDYAELLGNYLTVGDGEYYTKTNNSIYITCKALPTFGNKEIVIEFTDLYDFTFSYYIVFEASADIDSSSITTQTIYEGDTISVFNKRNNSGLDGIGFIFKNIDGDIIEDQSIFLQNAYIIVPENATSEKAFVGGGGYDGIVKVAGNEIKFNYADWDSTHWAGNQTFWECYGNGSQVALTLRVIISGEDTEGAETYFRDYPIFYTKRYSMSLEEENTYVRDGVEFNMENLISVMDNKNSRYLGEPKIYDADAYKLDAFDSTYGGIQINELYDYGTGDEYPVEFKYDYKYKDPEDSTKNITAEASYYISKFNVYNMMLYLADKAGAVTDATTFKVDGPDDYDSVGNNNTINYSMTINKDFVATVLKELGIEQSPTDKTIFTLSLNIGLRNNNTSKTANIVREFRLNIEQVHSDPATISAIVGDSDNYIVLGSYQPEPVLEDVTFDNTTFKLYTVLDGENEISWTGPEDKASLIKAKAGLLSNGITHTSVKLLDISISDKVDGDGINVIIKTSDGKLHAENIKSSTTLTSMIILSDGKYLGQNPELYTGYYTESSGNYTVAGLEGTQCFNGLTIDDVKQAKFLHSVYMNDLYTNKLDLEKDKAFFTSSKYGVDYQSKSVIIKYELYDKAGYLYSFSANANVTLKYTGINTDDAYIGNSSIHYIEFSASANVDDENATVNEKQLTVSLISSDSFVGDGTKTVFSSNNLISHEVFDVLVNGAQLDSSKYSIDQPNGIITFDDPVAAGAIIVVKYGGLVWGDEFKLTPGVGKVATLAYSAKEDLSLQSLGLLRYELTGVYAGSNTTTSSVASIDQTTGILTLMEGYRLNDYYISIRISCAYPSDDLGDYEYRPIGTVNVGFRYTIST